MSDMFSGGTPWDDAPSAPPTRPAGKPDFSSETPWDAPKAKRVAQQGPIFQGYGQKAKKIKTPKPPKPKKTGDEGVLFEKGVRVVWRTLGILRTISVVIFILSVAVFTYAFAVGATGNPWVFVGALPGVGSGVHPLAPMMAQVVGVALAATLAGVASVNLARPHGKFREFTSRSWVWAAAAVIAFPVLLVLFSWLLGAGAQAFTGALPANWHWVFDPLAPPPVGAGAPGAPIPTVTPTVVPTP